MQPTEQLQRMMQNHQVQGRSADHNLPSLYIGDLDKTVLDSELYNFFQRHGFKPKKTKVILDPQTKKHQGFAYACFYKQEEADKAQEELNGKEINGRPVRISKKQDKVSFEKGANLIVLDLHPEASLEDLKAHFLECGNVLSIKIERFEDGTPRGLAFVQMEAVDQAKFAIEKVNGVEIKGKPISVQLHKPWFERQKEQNTFNNLFIQNLPKDFDEAKLTALFEPFGKIISLKVNNKENNSLGFVTYEQGEHALKAIKKLNETFVEGHFIFVQKHYSKKELEHQMKNPNSHASQILNHQNRNTIVIRNYSQIPTAEVLASVNKSGKVLTHTEKVIEGKGTLIHAILENQKQVQDAIKEMNGTPALRVDQWVSPELLKQERQNKQKQNNMQFLTEMMRTIQNPNQNHPQNVGGQYPSYGAAMPQPAAQPRPAAPVGPKINKPQYNEQELKQAEEQDNLDALKNIVGTAIYVAVTPVFGDQAGKITGMMIERTDFKQYARQYLENFEFFQSQVQQAVIALRSNPQ